MSVPSIPPSGPALSPPPTGRPHGLGGCLAAILILVGIVLLLPGLCSLIFLATIGGAGVGWPIALLWLVCLMIGVGGLMLINYAAKNR